MPKYQYACPDCGNEFEATQKFADKPLKKCPTCGRRNIYRAIRQVAVSFRGSGFYINDSKSSDSKTLNKPKPEEKPNAEAVSTDSKDASSTETTATPTADTSKPETKTDSKPASVAKPEPKVEQKETKKESKAKPAD